MKYSVIILVLCVFSSLISFVANAEDKKITYIGTDQPWPPIAYINLDAPCNNSGIFIDILTEIFINRLSLDLECDNLPWKRAQRQVEKGLRDVLITVPTEKRAEYSVISDLPVFQMYFNVYTYKGHKKMEEIRNIKKLVDIKTLNLSTVAEIGNGWHTANIESLGIESSYMTSSSQTFKYLALKRADILITEAFTANDQIKKLKLSNKLVLTESKFSPVNFHILLSKKSKYISKMPEINDAIRDATNDGSLDKIFEKYLKLD